MLLAFIMNKRPAYRVSREDIFKLCLHHLQCGINVIDFVLNHSQLKFVCIPTQVDLK